MNIEKIICYGAGSAFHWVEEVLESRCGTQILAVIDKGFEFLQSEFRCPVIDPTNQTQMSKCIEDYPNVPVVVTLGNPVAASVIVNNLIQLGFSSVYTLNEIYEAHLGFQLEDTHLDELDEQLKLHQSDVHQIAELLSDSESKRIFNDVVSIYTNKQGTWIVSRPSSKLHFPDDLVGYIDYDCVVRCGVALDEIQDILGQDTYLIKELICFEPCIEKFQLDGLDYSEFLKMAVRRSDLNAHTRFSLIPSAVSSRNGVLQFHSVAIEEMNNTNQTARYKPQRGSFGSRLDVKGNCLVRAITLDSALIDKKPTVIFVDAEGAEMEILSGARNGITEHRPVLVIALYHRLSHMWEIPHFIVNNFKEYSLYVRNYTGFIYETFLYAIPEPRTPLPNVNAS